MAHSTEPVIEKKSRLFLNNRSQAVRLPKEFQFEGAEVFLRKIGDSVLVSPRPTGWSDYIRNGPVASPEFMEGVDDPPPEDIEL